MTELGLSPRLAGLWQYLSRVASDFILHAAMAPFAAVIGNDGATSIIDTTLLQVSGKKGLVANQSRRWLEDEIRARAKTQGLAAAGLIYDATARPQEGGPPSDALIAHLEERSERNIRIIAPYVISEGRVSLLEASLTVMPPNARWLV